MPKKLNGRNGGSNQEDLPLAIFMERDPALYARCVEMLEQGHSPNGISALLQVPRATVRQIKM
jgi:hypothetical protein